MNVRGDSTRSQLARQARTLFASRGIDAVSIRDIGVAAGLTNPAMFRHYASKEELAKELFVDSYGRLVAALGLAAKRDGIEAWLTAAPDEVAAEPDGVLYVMDNLRRIFARLPDDLRVDNLPRLVGAILAREQTAGRVRADLDVSLTVTLILGVLGQTARALHFQDGSIDVAEHARRLADLLNRGLAR